MYHLNYRRSDNQIDLVTEKGIKKSLTNCISSKPKISPKGLKAIYLSPLEWETLCSLYLVDLCIGKKQLLIGPIDERYIPRDAIWLNETKIALIIGDVYETYIDGGNVYIYDFLDNQLHKLTKWNKRKQAVKLEYTNGILYYEGVKCAVDDIQVEKKFIGVLDIGLYI
ncbi:hypothetical protein BK784_35575 [Bacillus thuringiensis serovar medellin]|uniref:Uncharacterized protein n=1 Tax=Bacillus thuringiensis subsp. medellin TaxID=79672 RepID=A0A9X6R8I8_BACTV|nr:hypothetical protein [Bacillus thuringiensis]OUB84502.1 hypothetical protein BK784_35575 [Bacillus thuringiensis serovar medellin]